MKAAPYLEALAMGVVREKHFVEVPYQEKETGQETTKLFQIRKNWEEGLSWWGSLTERELVLEGIYGYTKIFSWADELVKKEFANPEVFEEVHPLALPKKEYTFTNMDEEFRFFDEVSKHFSDPDDQDLKYWLASRFTYLGGSKFTNFNVCHVNSGHVSGALLHNLYYDILGNLTYKSYSYNLVLRPEATPKSTICLRMGGCDGSREYPWRAFVVKSPRSDQTQ